MSERRWLSRLFKALNRLFGYTHVCPECGLPIRCPYDTGCCYQDDCANNDPSIEEHVAGTPE